MLKLVIGVYLWYITLITVAESITFHRCRAASPQGQYFTLNECPVGQVINIQSAELGYSVLYNPTANTTRCPWSNCTKSTDEPATLCNGRRSCRISQQILVFPVRGSALCPLQKDGNFIRIKFTCVAALTFHRCRAAHPRGHYFTLNECPVGQVINIQSAELGYSESYNPTANPPQCPWRNCTRSTDEPARLCNGRRSCRISQQILVFPVRDSSLCSLQKDGNFIRIRYECVSAAWTTAATPTTTSTLSATDSTSLSSASDDVTLDRSILCCSSCSSSNARFSSGVVAGVAVATPLSFVVTVVIYTCCCSANYHEATRSRGDAEIARPDNTRLDNAAPNSNGGHRGSGQRGTGNPHTDHPSAAAEIQRMVASAGSASTSEDSDFCEVCLVTPRAGFALVPCGHARFCEACARRVADMESGCPVCRADITLVMRVFM